MPKKRGGSMNKENVIIAILVVILLGLVGYYVHLRMKKTENYENKSIHVIFYHMNGCGHCTAMMPEWEKFEKSVLPSNVTFDKIESRDIKPEHQDRVSGFPTICAEVDGDVKYHEGARTSDAILKWVKSL